MARYASAAHTARLGRARRRGHVTLLPVAFLIALTIVATACIAYVLWPRWPAAEAAINAPTLPITIGGTAFNVPPAAIRVPVQRRPGAQDRIDLAFLWPSLKPPDMTAKPPGQDQLPTASFVDRVFVTIAAAGEGLDPAQRVKTIYPRYVSATPSPGPTGLAVLAFRESTPYQGEDLIYDGTTPPSFIVRCTRNAGTTPGTCLYEKRIEAADIVVRFPRDWLADWQGLAADIDRLIATLRPRGS
jgi:hypothetical protein